jgi:hypothetical protein
LFSTSGCHLCELAKALVDELAAAIPLHCQEIEITTDEALVERYGVRIPVLRDTAGGKELGWPFDAEQLKDFVQTLEKID